MEDLRKKTWESRVFLMEELVKRDFKKKYKRSVLGILWSVLSPVLTMLVMRLMFTQFFGRDTPHYTTYILAGNIVFSFFRDTTSEGMNSIVGNSRVICKIDIPKTYFVWSKCVSFLINFAISVLVFLGFCLFDDIRIGPHFFALLYPMVCLFVFGVGTAMLLSALYVFMKDIRYLWSIALRLLMYMSAVFYRIDGYSERFQKMFLLNPVYVYISYFRTIAIDGAIPSPLIHGLCLLYALLAMLVGWWFFHLKQDRFVFYL